MSDGFEDFPRDIKAEQAALGSMLLSADALAVCLEMLEAAYFARPAHQEIFAAIAAMSARGEPADIITLKAELEHRGTLGKIGRAEYLHTLIGMVPSPASAGSYAGRIRECAIRWRMAEAGDGIRDAAVSGDADLGERIDRAYRLLDEAAGKAIPPKARSIADLIDPALARLEEGPGTAGVMTPWADVNELIGGWRGGQMITVGGRPGHGKSVVLVNAAVHAALELGLPVLACSLEMSEQEYIERIIASEGEVDLKRIRDQDLTDHDWERIADVRKRLIACPNLMINDDPYLTVQGIRSDLRTMRRAGTPAALVTVDYLQLMTMNGKEETRQTEVSAISRSLKLLAKEFDVPVLAGSQLNRGPEMRSDHRPLPADLRESGSQEQDSDIVILLYREDAYESESAHAGEVDFIVAKHRQGRQATVTLAFRGHVAQIADMYRPWDPAAVIEGAA